MTLLAILSIFYVSFPQSWLKLRKAHPRDALLRKFAALMCGKCGKVKLKELCILFLYCKSHYVISHRGARDHQNKVVYSLMALLLCGWGW